MSQHASVFEKEVLLDIAVNILPLVILASLAGLYLAFNHWPNAPLLGRLLQFGLIVVPFVVLAIVTYVAARQMEVVEDVETGP